MAILNDNLGGSDITDGQGLTHTDLNDTNDALLLVPIIAALETAYRTLQSNNVWIQGPNLLVDEFTDSNGTKNTVNTGSSTATFDTDTYSDIYTIDSNIGSDTTHDPDGFTNDANAFDGDTGTAASKNVASNNTVLNWEFGKTFSEKTIKVIHYRYNTSNFLFGSGSVYIQTFNGSTWSNASGNLGVSDGTKEGTYLLNSAVQGVRLQFNGPMPGATYSRTVTIYEITYGEYPGTATVLVDSGSLTLDGTEKAVVVFTDAVYNTNTGMTVQVGDSSSTVSAVSVNTSNQASSLIDISSLGSGTLELTFTLTTTDGLDTTEFKGYSVYLIR